ncbi:MAG: bifunctional phosphopantothenoylcysteine decarboxylase/phosphopantothenate--cysteine ligase CoaBC [Epsilonproteobacteria bacterium]|nr:bifunctional phosphopantothenoylcysteine decarboxylase/phosphopantothenate--cysteine ligase CoaBC [Campylobacterota bacterium]
MNNLLKDKNILVGVTGSIAIYKTLELIRLLVKSGANTRVIMSEEAKRFITPLTFEAISAHTVLHTQTESWANDNNHIHIGKWADIFVVAPISANSINKISYGLADNLLIQSLLAFSKQVLIAPSANTNMLLHPSTQKSLKKLQTYGYEIIKPQDKLLACLDKGTGAMAEPLEIFHHICRSLFKENFWKNLHIIITGGGTKEKIDDVRHISNNSSGKMANSLCLAAYYKGAKVTYISTKEQTDLPNEINFILARSSNELEIAINNNLQTNSYLFMASAVSDYVCKEKYNGKLKKSELGDEFSLQLIKNRDILKNINKQCIKTIGFKAEFDKNSALENAQKMLKEKNLDAVCLNVLESENGFGSDKNRVTFITKNAKLEFKLDLKLNISFEILEASKNI